MSERIRVLVTGVGSGGHGEQILKALKWSSLELEIVGTDTLAYSSGFPEVDHAYRVPRANEPHYLERLLELCRIHRTQVLFHGSEPELRVIGRHRQEFADRGVLVPINSERVLETCMDKSRTMKFLAEHGFDSPRSIVIAKLNETEQIDFFPVVIKPFIGSGGSANVFIAQDPRELRMLGEYLLTLCPQFLVQEYVGTPNDEYTVGVLHGMDGLLIGSIAVKRSLECTLSKRHEVTNRTGRADLGPKLVISSGVSQGEVGDFPVVTSACERIAAALGSTGPLNLQCRLVDGRVQLFEINPRYSGTTSLRAMAGFNEPELMIRRFLLHEDARPPRTISRRFIMRGLQERTIDTDRVRDFT